jgi:electron transfer flavoprotein beta subunit
MNMHIAVLLRLVPDISEDLEIDESGVDIDREWIGFKLNEFDDHALEEAVLLKESVGARVTAVGFAGDGVDRMLQSAIARGADAAVRIQHGLERVDSSRTAALLFDKVLDKLAPDLVLTGIQTPEDLFGQLAPTLAGLRKWPTLNGVSGVKADAAGLVVQQEYSGGLSASVSVQLPAVLGIQAASYPPRYVSGTKLRQAMSASIKSIDAGSVEPQPLRLSALKVPVRTSHAEMLEGDAEGVAAKVVRILLERGLAGA